MFHANRAMHKMQILFSLSEVFWLLVCVIAIINNSLPQRPHRQCLFSEVASRLFSSGVHSHDFTATYVVPAQ